MRSRTIAGFSGIFGGSMGIQFFYLGNVGLGISCMLFCWTFIPAIIGFFHGCHILSMTNDQFNKKYNKT